MMKNAEIYGLAQKKVFNIFITCSYKYLLLDEKIFTSEHTSKLKSV